jgi:L-arabinokinase
MTSIAFYISGHGFGHASRQIQIINAVAARLPGVSVFLRTSAARWLLDRTISPPFTVDSEPCDVGVFQIDSLRLDARATIDVARQFYRTLDERAAIEAAKLRAHEVALVISDAPPLASAAAAAADVPSVVVSNFTWDWIYEEYGEYLPSAPRLIPTIQNAYRRASAAWRLPMHGGFDTFQNVADVPFVARHARHGREETRARLGLPTMHPRLALVSFGGFGVSDLELSLLDCLESWDVVVTGRSAPGPLPRGVQFVNEEDIYNRGLRYEDLVHAVDAVVTKPGYGIISECIANDTPIVYTSRGRFREYDVLVREMPRYLKSAYLDQTDLRAGRWRAALDSAVGAPAPPEDPPTNGADLIAERIATMMSF